MSSNNPPKRFRAPAETLPHITFDAEAQTTDVPMPTDPPRGPSWHTPIGKRHGTLVVLSGLNAGQTFTIGDAVIMGRDREVGVKLEEGSLSRRHARVFRDADEYFVEDLGSRNGTRVNGERIEGKRQLLPGDRIGISGKPLLRFALVDESEERLTQQLFEASTRDPLTLAYNRRYLGDRLASELAFARRHRSPLGLIMFDIDRFKEVNDENGHQAGDAVLRAVSGKVGGLIRTEDVFARYGGEEFIVVARGVSGAGVVVLAERIRNAMADMNVTHDEKVLKVTVSIGVAMLSEIDKTASADDLVALADKRLMKSKNAGRNRTTVE